MSLFEESFQILLVQINPLLSRYVEYQLQMS